MIIEHVSLSEVFENVYLTGYLQLRPETDAAMIICAGGGYLSLNEDEAEYVAIQFLAKGYQTFILNYSVGAPYAYFPAPFIELAHAVATVRTNAMRYQVNPKRIYVCGLSTGGHIASMLGSNWNTLALNTNYATHPSQVKPDAIILGYPALDLDGFRTDLLGRDAKYAPFLEMMFSAVLATPHPDAEALKKWNSISAVSIDTVPSFIWNTIEDEWVNPDQSIAFVERLRSFNIPCKHLILSEGRHGEYKVLEKNSWIDHAVHWLNTI